MKSRTAKIANSLNIQTFNYYYYLLKDMAINNFKWINVPENIDTRYIELTLFNKGYTLFYKDDIMNSFECLPCTIGGRINNYHIPTERTAIGLNGYMYHCNETNSVIIFNNYLRTPDEMFCRMYAQRLANATRTVDVNIAVQKTPFIVLTDEKIKLSMTNILERINGFSETIFGTKFFNPDNIKVLNTNAPYVANDVMITKKQLLNEALSYLGIENSNDTKKERQITNEVDYALGNVYANRLRRLNARKDACEKINKMFGLNIDVEFALEYSYPLNDMGGDNNGNFYDDFGATD